MGVGVGVTTRGKRKSKRGWGQEAGREGVSGSVRVYRSRGVAKGKQARGEVASSAAPRFESRAVPSGRVDDTAFLSFSQLPSTVMFPEVLSIETWAALFRAQTLQLRTENVSFLQSNKSLFMRACTNTETTRCS